MKNPISPATIIKIIILLAILSPCFLFFIWLIDPDFVMLCTILNNRPSSLGEEHYPEPDRNPVVPANMKVLIDEGNPHWQSVATVQPRLPVHFRNEEDEDEKFSL